MSQWKKEEEGQWFSSTNRAGVPLYTWYTVATVTKQKKQHPKEKKKSGLIKWSCNVKRLYFGDSS